jgi:hypothetical protein
VDGFGSILRLIGVERWRSLGGFYRTEKMIVNKLIKIDLLIFVQSKDVY